MVTTTQKSIHRKRESLNKRQDKLLEERDALGDLCPHIELSIHYDSDTGNYDPSTNRYWVNVICLDCGGRWCFDNSPNETLIRSLVKEIGPRMCR